MNKASEAAAAIKAARDAVGAIMNALAMHIDRNNMQVHVSDARDLEQVPGTLEISDWDNDDFPYEAYKTLDGVRFFTLLTQAEYEALQQAS